MQQKAIVERCEWPGNIELMILYHDTEWGTPVHDDAKLFEFFLLDTFQAGLSWSIILQKRENFRKAFSNFDAQKIVRYKESKIQGLMENTGIIRNRLKIHATIQNARAFLEIQDQFGSFDKYIWDFVNGKPIQNHWTCEKEIPSFSEEAKQMSKDLKKRGFLFVGPTICYAFMQGAGLVNDHLVSCFRYRELVAK